MDDKEKVYLMLEEYRSLRSEGIDRTRLQHQLYAVAVVLAVVVIGYGLHVGARGLPLFLVLLTAILFAAPIALLQQDIHAAWRRAREIEAEVNRRAGERLFARETERIPLNLGEQFGDRAAWRERWLALQQHAREQGVRMREGFHHMRDMGRSDRPPPPPSQPPA